MITLFTGTPGSGKSYDAMRVIRRQLKRNMPVVANFEVNLNVESWARNFNYVANSQLSADLLIALASDYWLRHKFREDGFLVVIDEAQLLFNSRNWQDVNRMAWLELMSQHRKYGMRIIMICQADIMIDKQFRTLVEFEANHRRISSLGLFGKIVKLLAFGELFYVHTKYYGQNVKVDGELVRYSKKIAAMYNSYKAFERGSGAAQAAALPNSQALGEYNNMMHSLAVTATGGNTMMT